MKKKKLTAKRMFKVSKACAKSYMGNDTVVTVTKTQLMVFAYAVIGEYVKKHEKVL